MEILRIQEIPEHFPQHLFPPLARHNVIQAPILAIHEHFHISKHLKLKIANFVRKYPIIQYKGVGIFTSPVILAIFYYNYLNFQDFFLRYQSTGGIYRELLEMFIYTDFNTCLVISHRSVHLNGYRG